MKIRNIGSCNYVYALDKDPQSGMILKHHTIKPRQEIDITKANREIFKKLSDEYPNDFLVVADKQEALKIPASEQLPSEDEAPSEKPASASLKPKLR